MADNKINVTVSANTRKNITVSSTQQSTEITASTDTGRFWSQVSKNWAVSDVIVDNIDYSSKHYAGIAKESAENAQNIEEIVKNDYNAFLEASMTANSELQATKENAITEIESNKINAVDSMNAVKNDAVDSINSTKTTVLNDIELVAEGEKQEIEDLIDTGKDEIKDTIDGIKVLTTLEIGDIGFTQMAIDESKGKRRVLNGQLIIQDQYVEFTNIVKNSVALNPDLACTESEWQTELTMSANGVCYKYVIDDEAGTIRLPKYPDYFDVSINTGAKSQTVSVYGNGKSLGFNDGSQNFGLVGSYATNTRYALASPSVYGKNVGTKMTSNDFISNQQKSIGIVTSASNSGLTGSVTVPAVQSEKIKGTYFIQVATGAEVEDNIINEIELNNPFSLLDYKYSEYELNNLSWLRSEGQWNAKSIYPAVYDLLLKIYNGTETKAGVSVKLTTETFTDYDFVLNTAEETFRLQLKVKQKFLNAINDNMPVVGTGKALGVTDGTNTLSWASDVSGTRHPACTDSGVKVGSARNTKAGPIRSNVALGITTDPTKSGLIAKVSQSEVSGLYLYFYVGETVQNANLVNIGRIQETYTTKSMVDGKWVYKHQVLSTAITEGTYTLDLSNYLPNDGYVYEILCRLDYDQTTDGTNTYAHIQSDIIPRNYLTVGSDNTFGGVNMANSAIIPAKDYLKLTISGNMTEGGGVQVFGYRRVGTNL